MQFDQLKRREFMALLGGAAAWPLAARAQQGERVRRIGVLIASTADDPEAQARIAALAEALSQLGWIDGRNVRIDVRWATTNADGRSNVEITDTLRATSSPASDDKRSY